MLIYIITDTQAPDLSFLRIPDTEVKEIGASHFSFLTSMRIASEAKKNIPDLVIVFSTASLIGALSARRLVSAAKGGRPFKIVLWIGNSDVKTKALPREVALATDAVIFENETLKIKWSAVRNIDKVRNLLTIPLPPVGGAIATNSTGPVQPRNVEASEAPAVPRLVYVGPIGKGKRLKEMIESVLSLSSDRRPRVTVAGTAAAAYVMPAVKLARSKKLDVEWLGEPYDFDAQAGLPDGFFISDDVFCSLEKKLLGAGVPRVSTETLRDWLDPEKRKHMSNRAVSQYNDNFSEETFLLNFNKLMDSLSENQH